MLWLTFLLMRLSLVHTSALSLDLSCWHYYFFWGQESRLRMQAKTWTRPSSLASKELDAAWPNEVVIWDSMWPQCRGNSERKRHSHDHTDIIDHCSYPQLSLMPTCLEICVWSWTDLGPSLKLSNELAAYRMGQSQGETRSVFRCLFSLCNKGKHSTLWEIMRFLNIWYGVKYIRHFFSWG